MIRDVPRIEGSPCLRLPSLVLAKLMLWHYRERLKVSVACDSALYYGSCRSGSNVVMRLLPC